MQYSSSSTNGFKHVAHARNLTFMGLVTAQRTDNMKNTRILPQDAGHMSFCFLSPVRRPIVACFTEPVGTLMFVGRCVSRWRPCTDMQQPRQQHMTHMHHAVTFSRHLSKPPQNPHSIQHHVARRPISFNTSRLRSINWKLRAASLPQQLSIPSQYSSSSTNGFKDVILALNATCLRCAHANLSQQIVKVKPPKLVTVPLMLQGLINRSLDYDHDIHL